jgi:hypothetical protein
MALRVNDVQQLVRFTQPTQRIVAPVLAEAADVAAGTVDGTTGTP